LFLFSVFPSGFDFDFGFAIVFAIGFVFACCFPDSDRGGGREFELMIKDDDEKDSS
jgi:hypothetical protein